MIKFMGHPINAYDRIDPVALFRQVDRYRKHLAGSFTARVGENSAHINQSHPRMVTRAIELAQWRDDGGFDEVLHCGPEGREAMLRLVSEDPVAHALLSTAGTALCNWATGEFSCSLAECGPFIRRMVRGDSTPPKPPFNSILRMELSISRKSADSFEYTICLLLNRDGQPVRVKVPVPWSEERDDVPAEVRAEMMRGNTDTVVRVLYPAEKGGK
jgi:hypothetical protein